MTKYVPRPQGWPQEGAPCRQPPGGDCGRGTLQWCNIFPLVRKKVGLVEVRVAVAVGVRVGTVVWVAVSVGDMVAVRVCVAVAVDVEVWVGAKINATIQIPGEDSVQKISVPSGKEDENKKRKKEIRGAKRRIKIWP